MFIQLVSAFFLINSRYFNQGLILEQFDYTKTGNMVSLFFFAGMILFIVLNMFISKKLRDSSLLLLLLVSVAGLVTVLFVNYVSPKDEKVFFSSLYIFIAIFTLYSLIVLVFSHSKKLHFFSNLFVSVVIFLVICTVIFLKIYNFKDDSMNFTGVNFTKKADAGIIFGAAVWGGNRPSPVLRERINKGYEVYKNGYVKKLILTGGGSPNEMTEADVAWNELIKYGVSKNDLIMENTSNSTMEQIFFLRDNLYKPKGWSKILLISDNFHLYRISEICSFNNINSSAMSSDTPLSPAAGVMFCVRETFAVLMFWVFGYG